MRSLTNGGTRRKAVPRPCRRRTLIGFSVIEMSSTDEDDEPHTAPSRQPHPPTYLAALRAGEDREQPDDAIRVAARTAVRSYAGLDDFVLRVRSAHAGDRHWLPNMRTATALLRIVESTNRLEPSRLAASEPS